MSFYTQVDMIGFIKLSCDTLNKIQQDYSATFLSSMFLEYFTIDFRECSEKLDPSLSWTIFFVWLCANYSE